MITDYGKSELRKRASLISKSVLGTGTLAGRILQGIVDAGMLHPVLVGAPIAGTLAAYIAQTRNTPAANVAWVDPRNSEYYMKPSMLFHKLKRNNPNGI